MNGDTGDHDGATRRLVADGGESPDEDDEESEVDTSNVEVMDAGEAEPAEPQWEMPDIEDEPETGEVAEDPAADSDPPSDEGSAEKEVGGIDPDDPKWEEPDLDELDDFEIRADDPPVSGVGHRDVPDDDNPTAGMPNTAGAPGTRMAEGSASAYIAALELCVHLPDEVRLPEEAAEVVPTAVEAEVEEDVQSFAAAEFDNPSPHIEALAFEEVDGEIWMRLRLGVSHSVFENLDPEAIRHHALQELDGMF